jgi:hypothetical protein
VFVQSVSNALAILRPYWKSLQLLNDNDSVKLQDYLNHWEEKYRKDVKFDDLANREKNFPLTGFYPLYPEEDNMRLDRQIDELIEATDLFVPDSKTLLVSRDFDIKNLPNTISTVVATKDQSTLRTTIENIGSRKVRLRKNNFF